MKYSKQSVVGGIILGVSILYGSFFKKDYRIDLKKKNTEIGIGKITREYIPTKSMSHSLTYKFDYAGKQFSKGRNITGVLNSPHRFVNKFFPVVFSKDDPAESAILITPDDFAFFDRDFPDSLSWVIQWVKTEH